MQCVDQVVVDIVLRLPEALRAQAVAASGLLADQLDRDGSRSFFRLGQPYPGDPDDAPCEPHVSLYMLTVDKSHIADLLRILHRVGHQHPAVQAVGSHYAHNPQGAPEVYFTRTPVWQTLQQLVIAEMEPVREGRLRSADPSGASIADLIRQLERTAPDSHQLRQLRSYGYDEVTDDLADRFNPHVTLAWPVDGHRVRWEPLAPVSSFSGTLDEIAVYGMGRHGTCLRSYGSVSLTSSRATTPRRA